MKIFIVAGLFFTMISISSCSDADYTFEMSQFEEKTKEIAEHFSQIERKISQNEANISKIRKSIDQIESEILNFEAKMNQSDAILNQINAKVSENDEKFSQLEAQIKQIQAKIVQKETKTIENSQANNFFSSNSVITPQDNSRLRKDVKVLSIITYVLIALVLLQSFTIVAFLCRIFCCKRYKSCDECSQSSCVTDVSNLSNQHNHGNEGVFRSVRRPTNASLDEPQYFEDFSHDFFTDLDYMPRNSFQHFQNHEKMQISGMSVKKVDEVVDDKTIVDKQEDALKF